MKSLVKLALVSVLSVSVLGGCAIGAQTLAQESNQTIQSKIVRGKTTKAEVFGMFGEPTQKAHRASGEVWMYSLSEASFKTFIPFMLSDNGSTQRNLEITFSKKDVVADYEYAVSRM